MRVSAAQVRTLTRHGLTALVLALVFGVYYAFRIPAQRTYFTQRDFRLLAAMSRQIQETVANLCSSLTNAAQPPQFGASNHASGRYWEAVQHAASASKSADAPLNLARLKAVLDLVPNLTLVEWRTNAPAAGSNDARGLRLRVVAAGDASWLELAYQGTDPVPIRLTARSDLRRWLEPIFQRREFDDVLLVDGEGNVLFQSAGSALRLTKLALPADRPLQTNLVDSAGADYKLFSQPVLLASAAPATDAPPSLIRVALCGLVKADRFRKETLAVNYTVGLVFLLLALLLILSWPLVNVWFLDPNDGLHPAEVFRLAFCTLAMTAFLTLLVFDLYAYNRTEDELDEGLEDFAATMLANVQTELGRAAAQMDLLNARFLTNAANQTNVLRRADLVQTSPAASDPYPWFQMAAWIDREGQQRVKWTVERANTPLVNVGQRAYFRQIVDGRPWRLASTNGTIRFCLEPVYSVNTGEYLCMFSSAPQDDCNLVTTLELPMLALVEPVLPAGYGFCVLDAAGLALFHSEAARNLRENFVEECNQDPRLRAAVYGRETNRFDVNYGQRVHSLFVRPVPGVPWTLAVFRDEQHLATAQVEMVSSAALLFLLGAASLTIAFGVLYMFGREKHLAWIRPAEDHASTYGLLIAVYLVLASLFMVSLWLTTRPGWLVLRGLAVPVLALLVTYQALSRAWPAPAALRAVARGLGLRLSYRARYVGSMGLLLLLLGVLPTAAFFSAAFLSESRLLVKQAQLQFAQDLEARAEHMWRDVQRAAPPDLNAFFDQRMNTGWDTYFKTFFNSEYAPLPADATEAAHPADRRTVFDSLLASFRPRYDDLAVQTGGVMVEQAADASWGWTTQTGRLVFATTATHFPGGLFPDGLRITSALPRLPRPTLLWALGLLAVLPVPFLIAYVVAKRLLLPSDSAVSADASVLLEPPGGGPPRPRGPGKYLLLGSPRTGKTDRLDEAHFVRLQPGAFRRIDLRRAEGRQWLTPARRDDLFRPADQAIVVDHLEYNLEEPPFNRAKLQFLRQFAYDEQRTVILVSSVHPLHFHLAAQPADAKKSGPPRPSDREIWAELLTVYKTLYSQGSSTPPAASSGQTSQRIRARCQSLWNTCSPAEQVILHHVAHRGLVRTDGPALRALVERGVLRREARLQFVDPEFPPFVLRHYRPGTAAVTSAEARTGLWPRLKGPVLTALVLVAGFIFATQQDLWRETIAVITAFTAGFGVLFKAVEMFPKIGLKKLESE